MAPVSDAWRPGQDPWLDSKTVAFDRMFAAGRLALVEDRVTGTSLAESLWLAAAKYAQEQDDLTPVAQPSRPRLSVGCGACNARSSHRP
jgi:hypothetical protein